MKGQVKWRFPPPKIMRQGMGVLVEHESINNFLGRKRSLTVSFCPFKVSKIAWFLLLIILLLLSLLVWDKYSQT